MGRLRDLVNGGAPAPAPAPPAPAPEVKSEPKATAPKKFGKKSAKKSEDRNTSL